MVRADPKRNYYADLELSSTADSEEIKKQFRMLGMNPFQDARTQADLASEAIPP